MPQELPTDLTEEQACSPACAELVRGMTELLTMLVSLSHLDDAGPQQVRHSMARQHASMEVGSYSWAVGGRLAGNAPCTAQYHSSTLPCLLDLQLADRLAPPALSCPRTATWRGWLPISWSKTIRWWRPCGHRWVPWSRPPHLCLSVRDAPPALRQHRLRRSLQVRGWHSH